MNAQAASAQPRYGFGALLLALTLLPACAWLGMGAKAEPGVIFGQVWATATCNRPMSPEQQKATGCEARPRSAPVMVVGVDHDWQGQTTSDPQGYYRIEVPPGRYRLSTPASGVLKEAVAEATVAAGEKKELWLRQANRGR